MSSQIPIISPRTFLMTTSLLRGGHFTWWEGEGFSSTSSSFSAQLSVFITTSWLLNPCCIASTTLWTVIRRFTMALWSPNQMDTSQLSSGSHYQQYLWTSFSFLTHILSLGSGRPHSHLTPQALQSCLLFLFSESLMNLVLFRTCLRPISFVILHTFFIWSHLLKMALRGTWVA